MRILHLLASWKWTGPAEPALETAALLASKEGLQVSVAHGSRTKGEGENHVAREVKALGLGTLDGLVLPRHFSIRHIFGDVGCLVKHLRRGEYDLLHCHTGVDHLVAGLALKMGRLDIPLVRTWYAPEGPATWREAWLLRSVTAAAVVPGRVAREKVARWSRGRTLTETLLPPLDLDRFDPKKPNMREEYLFGPDDFVIGAVARMQPHRKWEILLEAFRLALKRRGELKLMIVGRGPDWERLIYGPAEEMGVLHRLVLAGYRRGDDFAATLRSMDAMAFLQPGSDGTCRALRQALASGVPAAVPKVGLLPELVRHGVTGLLTETDPEQLAEVLVTLATERERAASMGESARKEGEARYSPTRYLEKIVDLYERVSNGEGECAG